MDKLSVVIITYNEEQNIARCIASVSGIADEIIVLDSFSTDNTIRIARAMDARVFSAPFTGYASQKNKALELASHDYVLSLDADEAIDDQLRLLIQREKYGFRYDGYTMNRCANYCGQFIRFGTWYPDRKLRLFNRHKAIWGGLDPHDRIILEETSSIGHLKGEILHYSYHTVLEHDRQNERFSSIAAEARCRAGKSTNRLRILFNPAWAFFHDYILRLGLLNGKNGWIIARKQAHYTFSKHSKLYELMKKRKKKVVV